jgi:hypothetical protein
VVYWLRYDTFCQFGGNGNGEKKWAKVKGAKKKGSGSGSGGVAVTDRCRIRWAFEWCQFGVIWITIG